MKKITSVNDLYPDYPQTFSLIRLLDAESYSFNENDQIMILNFTNPKGSLPLTLKELMIMNHPSFMTIYQKDSHHATRQEVLDAIKGEFKKEIFSR